MLHVPLAVVASLWLATAGATDPPFLRVERARFDEAAREIRFDLVNVSGQPLTAWSLDFVTHTSDGREILTGVTEDYYHGTAFEDLVPGAARLLAPGSHQKSFGAEPPPGTNVRQVEVRVVCAIREDTLTSGDERCIGAFFDGRRADRDALRDALRELRHTRPDQRPLDRLRSLRSAVERDPVKLSRSASVRASVISAVGDLERSVEAGRIAESEVFAWYEDRLTRQLNAARANLPPGDR